MNDATFVIDRAAQAQLDRLAAGELPEGERLGLLAWLDEDPRRWRACAVTFLEAQCWEAAAAEWPTGSVESRPNLDAVQPGLCPRQTASAVRGGWRKLALAAALVAAFFSGAAVVRLAPVGGGRQTPMIVERPSPRSMDEATTAAGNQPLLATVSVRTNLDPQVPAQLQVPVTPWSADAEVPVGGISEYERKQWERRGFELSEERRYLPARLPDGREVVVPVNQVHLKFKGTPVS